SHHCRLFAEGVDGTTGGCLATDNCCESVQLTRHNWPCLCVLNVTHSWTHCHFPSGITAQVALHCFWRLSRLDRSANLRQRGYLQPNFDCFGALRSQVNSRLVKPNHRSIRVDKVLPQLKMSI